MDRQQSHKTRLLAHIFLAPIALFVQHTYNGTLSIIQSARQRSHFTAATTLVVQHKNHELLPAITDSLFSFILFLSPMRWSWRSKIIDFCPSFQRYRSLLVLFYGDKSFPNSHSLPTYRRQHATLPHFLMCLFSPDANQGTLIFMPRSTIHYCPGFTASPQSSFTVSLHLESTTSVYW